MFDELIGRSIKLIYRDIQLGRPANKSVIGILKKVENDFLFIKSSNGNNIVISVKDVVSIEEVFND